MSADLEYIEKEKKHWEEICTNWDLWDGYETKDFLEVINSDWVTIDLLKKIGNNLIKDSDSYENLYNSLNKQYEIDEEEHHDFAEKIYEMTKLDKDKDNDDMIELKKNIKKLFKGKSCFNYVRDGFLEKKYGVDNKNYMSDQNITITLSFA